jgi:carboxyl-terminal processing protease
MKSPIRISPFLLVLGLAAGLSTMDLRGQAASARAATGATEANITRLTTNLLEQSQFAHHPLDSELAGNFLDRYLDDLDGSRSLFLQPDVKEFAAYRATLAQATRDVGDTSAAHAIFARYLQRLQQRVDYNTNLLRTAKFDFTGHDVYSVDREHAQWPRDLTAAQKLWRQQIRADYLQEKLADKRPEQIVGRLMRRQAQQLAMMKSLRSDEVLETYLNALAHVYDPHSDYLGHQEMETLSIAMKLSLFGIGASLESEDGTCKIRELLPGGPAARSGLLQPGDRILAVAQSSGEPVDITDMPLSRAVELIRGPKGSTVKLTILPVGAADGSLPKTISLVRDEVNLEDQQAKARILDMPTGQGATVRLGVIDLPSFYADLGGPGERRSATADVARLLKKLKAEHVSGVVLDLRRNGGGSLDEAVSLTGLFLREGPVVQTRGPRGDIDVDADTDPSVLYDGPLVLLISRFSASASEILVGALQDYGRGVVVGDSSTFGKGTVQNILPLAFVMDKMGLEHAYDPGALKVTIRKFYRPNGASTQLRGVASDIVLPSPSDFSEVSESTLKDPLPWDTVTPAPHERLNRVQPYLSALREKSIQRVKTEKDFALLADDLAQVRKSLATKSVSLNEAERRQELAQSKARQDERVRESRIRFPFRPATYEITLKNVSSPGLPPPMAATKSVAAAHGASSSSAPNALAPDAASRSLDDDIVLNETVKILADYVDLLNGQANPAGPGHSVSAL